MPQDARALVNALNRLSDRAAGPGGRAAALAMAREGTRETRQMLNRRRHSPGTPSPSPAGQPPARITGDLQRSLLVSLPHSGGPARWVVKMGPTAPYGRIQERGGRTGRRHATTLPPRPYMAPAAAQVQASGAAERVAVTAFRRAVRI